MEPDVSTMKYMSRGMRSAWSVVVAQEESGSISPSPVRPLSMRLPPPDPDEPALPALP
jgi:hypothetical protein